MCGVAYLHFDLSNRFSVGALYDCSHGGGGALEGFHVNSYRGFFFVLEVNEKEMKIITPHGIANITAYGKHQRISFEDSFKRI